MSTATPILIPTLRELEKQGLNRQALLLIQLRLISNAKRVSQTNDPKELISLASGFVTKGPRIYQAYIEALTSINKAQVSSLEKIGQHLLWIEAHLERSYAQALAQSATSDLPLKEFALRQGSIAEVYASVLKSAVELGQTGNSAVNHSATLLALLRRPSGPLQAIYDKASEIAFGENSHNAQRQRAA